MCGIVGWVVRDASAPPENTVGSMLAAIAHRGPDDQGVYHFRSPDERQQVALGHRRLAIIDPSGARQPMCDPDAGIALVFNGEIYNFRALRATLVKHGYRFERDSDTEVLLRAYQLWGSRVVDRLRGMFAFALWDTRRGRLLLARDRFGEKPLFLHQRGTSLYFASEIKALLRIPEVADGVNLEAVWEYLAYRYVPGPATLFNGIRKLPPGTLAIWENGVLKETRYWAAPDRTAAHLTDPGPAAVETFSEQLSEVVGLQMVSDVPLGAFLSGGIDSSTIVAHMSRHSTTVNTFSAGFAESAYSELAYAAEVARHFGTRHHEVVISDRDIMERLPALVAQRDAPVSEPSDIPLHLLACEAARSVKVVLTGEGSDEVLGGYPKHIAERFAVCFQHLPGTLRRGFLAPLVHALPYGFRRIKTAMANLNIENWHERQARWFGALSHAERSDLSVLRPPESKSHPAPFDSDPRASSLRRALYFDQASWLPDNLLERADRVTMAASIEARTPFLDHKLAAFVSSLPDHYRVRGLRTKWILRESAKRLLPARILSRPKVGFRVPVNEWFRGPMRDYLREHLLGESSVTKPYYAARSLERILGEHFAGRQNHEKLLWTLLNLEIWHRQYGRAA